MAAANFEFFTGISSRLGSATMLVQRLALVLSGLAPKVQARDQARALPQLAAVSVHLLFRDLDGGFIVVRFNPFRGHDLLGPVEAVKPVTCHFSNRISAIAKRSICHRNERMTAWFQRFFLESCRTRTSAMIRYFAAMRSDSSVDILDLRTRLGLASDDGAGTSGALANVSLRY